MKQVILVTSFGTSYFDTLEKNIVAIEREVADKFPGYDIARAFTSEIIRAKLKKRDNIEIDNVQTALERFTREGYSKAIIQPTLIINGLEYEKKILAAVEKYKDKFDYLKIGTPLLTETEDYTRVSKALEKAYGNEEIMIFVGHGTPHHSDAAYAALDYHFKANGLPNFFVGALGGYPDMDTVYNSVKRFSGKKVTLAPLMLVAGDHAVNDITGDEDSWKTFFESKDYSVSCRLSGLGELSEIRSIYCDHITSILK